MWEDLVEESYGLARYSLHLPFMALGVVVADRQWGKGICILGYPQKKKTNQENEDIQARRQVTILPTQSILSISIKDLYQ